MAIITLTTDFGTRDGYVGAMKGVIARIAGSHPAPVVVDLAHDIPPGDIAHAAWVVATSTPGVPARLDPRRRRRSRRRRGAPRRGRARARAGGTSGPTTACSRYVADRTSEAYAIENERFRAERVSRTFHGRDVFAPTAAAIASRRATPRPPGRRVELAGALPWGPRGREVGRVVHIDRFGNLITDLPERRGRRARSPSPARSCRCVGTYEDVAPGELLAYIGSARHRRDRGARRPRRPAAALSRGAPVAPAPATRRAGRTDERAARRDAVDRRRGARGRRRRRRPRRGRPRDVRAADGAGRSGARAARASRPRRSRAPSWSSVEAVGPGAGRAGVPRTSRDGCGGCQWQHVARPAQLAAKQAIVAGALRKLAGLRIHPIADPAPALGWRRRARFHVARGRAGLYELGGHRVVPIARCPQLEPALDAALRRGARGRRRPTASSRCCSRTTAGSRSRPSARGAAPRALIGQAGHRRRARRAAPLTATPCSRSSPACGAGRGTSRRRARPATPR